MRRAFLPFLVFCGLTMTGMAADGPVIKNPSPNGRFALRLTDSKGDGALPTIELIEKETGKAIVDLGTSYYSVPATTILVWSPDSKRFAYATRGPKEGDVSVYFWNGSTFEAATMPEQLPEPDIKFGKGADGGVKNYGGAPKPLRWLKSGELELSNDSMMLSRGNGKSYTGVVVFTLVFDKQHRGSVHTVGKSKTLVD